MWVCVCVRVCVCVCACVCVCVGLLFMLRAASNENSLINNSRYYIGACNIHLHDTCIGPNPLNKV